MSSGLFLIGRKLHPEDFYRHIEPVLNKKGVAVSGILYNPLIGEVLVSVKSKIEKNNLTRVLSGSLLGIVRNTEKFKNSEINDLSLREIVDITDDYKIVYGPICESIELYENNDEADMYLEKMIDEASFSDESLQGNFFEY